MEKGDVSGLSCRFNQGATDRRVEWMSSNPAIVRVDAAGRVTAVSAGETYVVATTPSAQPTSLHSTGMVVFRYWRVNAAPGARMLRRFRLT